MKSIFTISKRDRALYLLWGLICVIYLIQVVYYYSTFREKYPYVITVSLILKTFFIGLLLVRFLVIPIFDLVRSKTRAVRITVLVLNGMVYSLLYILLIFVLPAIEQENSLDEYLETVSVYLSSDLHNTFKNYLFLVAAMFAYELLDKQREWMTKKQAMELELSDTKLKMLKSRLQPHFLFNSLNGVVAVIDENSRKAQEMLIRLSEVLRTTLNADFRSTHSLLKEKEYLEKYLGIEKARYEEQLDYKMEFTENSEQMKLPVLILQPLVENAIKHGFKGGNGRLTIDISADADLGWVSVKNNGAPLPGTLQFGEGLSQVSDRLALFGKNQLTLEYGQKGGWVEFRVKLPQ